MIPLLGSFGLNLKARACCLKAENRGYQIIMEIYREQLVQTRFLEKFNSWNELILYRFMGG